MNTDKDIDKTIEKIDADLKANEQPLPKAAPTQYRLHQRPREMSLAEHLAFQHQHLLEQFVVEDMDCEEFRQRARQLGIIGNPPDITYQVKCQHCNYRFPKQNILFQDGTAFIRDVTALIERHANRYQHTVEFHVDAPACPHLNMEASHEVITFLPVKWLWYGKALWFWHRHGDKIIVPMGCLFVVASLYSIFGLGVKGWIFRVHCGALALWGLNLGIMLWQKIKKQFRQ